MADGEARWTAACVALVAGITVVDIVLGGGLETVLVLGPLVASSQLRPQRTGFVAGLAVVCGAAVAGANGHLGHLAVALRVIATAGLGGLCVGLARTRERRERHLERLAEVAEIAQHAILPPIPPRVGNVAFATRYLSAAEDALLGGDLYDVVVAGDAVRLLVGDVRGKGLEGIRLAVVVLGLFRRAAAVEAQLDAVAKAVDSALRSHLDEEDFVTAVFVEFTEGQVSVVNCGHYPPLRISGRGVETLAAAEPSPPLGLDPEFAIRSYSLDTDERLLVYTDGLIEARDPYGAFFDLEAPAALSLTQGTLDAALDTLVRRLLAHVGGRLNDDMALVLAQPVSADPGWRGRLSDPVPAEFG